MRSATSRKLIIGSVAGVAVLAAFIVPTQLDRMRATGAPEASRTVAPAPPPAESARPAPPAATPTASAAATATPAPSPTETPDETVAPSRTPRPMAVPESVPAAPSAPTAAPIGHTTEPSPSAPATPPPDAAPVDQPTEATTPSPTSAPTGPILRPPGMFALQTPIDVSGCSRDAASFTVSWTTSSGADRYTVSGIPNGVTVAAPTTSTQLPCPSAGTTYYLVVTATNDRNLPTSTSPVAVTFPEPLDEASIRVNGENHIADQRA